MSFTQQHITKVNPPRWSGSDLLISWTDTAPAGMAAQVYVDGVLQWHGTGHRCHVPWPSRSSWFAIGHVAMGDATLSFAGSLPAHPQARATLAWQGGTFQGADIRGFRVYGESAPGAGIDYTTPLADMAAYAGGLTSDGYGYGGYGQGGYGQSPGSYSWTSDPLPSGTWHFAVAAYGSAGTQGSAAATAVAIQGPPAPPAPYAGTMSRLAYGLSADGSVAATLLWNPSPTI